MATFLSLVGLQPAATAVALTTWLRWQGPVHRAVFLATPQARRAAHRLAVHFARPPACLACDVVEVSPALIPADGLPAPAEAVRPFAGEPLVFCGDPGLTFHVGTVARALPPETTFVHADAQFLHAWRVCDGQEQWDRQPLASLGLAALLALYGVRVHSGGTLPPLLQRWLARAQMEPLPDAVERGVRLGGEDHLQLDLAFEARGTLHGLVVIDAPEPGVRLQKARDVEELTLGVRGLRPRLAGLTVDGVTMRRLRLANHQAIDARAVDAATHLRRWVAGAMPAPGRGLYAGREYSHLASEQAAGAGGEGGPLAVCLGLDPSPTLMSLCTHRPKQAWVFYDERTPAIHDMAGRLLGAAGDLPVGTMTLVRTDHVGRGIHDWFHHLRGGYRGGPPAPPAPPKVDLTPGTKAQACLLARAAPDDPWVLLGDEGVAASAVRAERRPLATPDALTQARVVGGPLQSDGEDARAVSETQQRFLLLVAQVLAAWRAAKPQQRRGFLDAQLRNLGGPGGQVHVLRGTAEAHAPEAAIKVVVRRGAQKASGTLPANGGHWYERVVAAAFVAAECDDVRLGVRWGWPDQRAWRNDADVFKDDLDVLVRLGHRFLAVSCKAGLSRHVGEFSRQVAAVARHGVGRLAIPMLVYVGADKAVAQQSRQARDGVLVLDVGDIADPAGLRALLEEVFRRRSTRLAG